MSDKETTKRKVMGNMVWRFGERILAQLTTFIVSVFLARILPAAAFGDVALLMVFIDIANVLVVQGFASALVQKKNADNIDFSSVFFFSIIVSIFFYFLCFVGAPLLVHIGDSELPSLFRALALRIPLAAINSVQHAYVQRKLQFRKFFFMTLIGTVISAGVGIYMALSGFGAWAIVGQYLTNSFCDTIVLWFTIGWRPVFVMDFSRLKELIGFGWKMLCSGLVHVVYNRLTTFYIGTKYTTEDLAYYEQGQKIPGIIETNIDTTINSVLFPVMSAEQDNRDRVKQMVRKSIQTSGCIIWPLMMGLTVLSDQFILLIYGDKWLPAQIFMIIASIKLTLEPIQTANLQAIKAIGRSDIYLKMEIAKKIYGLMAILIGIQISVLATAIASATQFLFALFINGIVNSRLFSYSVKEQVADIAPSALLSIVMIGVVYLAKVGCSSFGLISILIEIIIGAIVYVLLLYFFNRSQFSYIVSLLRGFLNRA